MLVINTTYKAMAKALELVNGYYEDNIKFGKLEPKDSSDIAMATRFLFSLRVVDSRGAGSQSCAFSERRSSSACWHVHGDFFDFLNSDAKIKSAWASSPEPWIKPGDKWNPVIKHGPMGSTVELSELCDC